MAVLGLVACDGQTRGSSAAGPDEVVGPDARKVSLGPAVGRRLTREEYINSLEVVLGAVLDADEYDLPRDARIPGGFRNSAQDMLLSPARVQAYDAIATDAVAQADLPGLVSTHAPCTQMRDECYTGFVDEIGLLLLRGPVPDADRTTFSRLFTVAEEEGEGFDDGAALVMRAMLQSPRFLYRLESQAGNDPGTGREVDAFELATRPPFLVWNAGPDGVPAALARDGTDRFSLGITHPIANATEKMKCSGLGGHRCHIFDARAGHQVIRNPLSRQVSSMNAQGNAAGAW